MKVRSVSLFILLFLVSLAMVPVRVCGGPAPSASKKIPVILDTDIGDDIDDTWALVMLLKSPEFDIKMVIGDNHNGIYRAKIIARMLEIAGRTDIPIGMAYSKRQDGGNQSDWVKDYDLKSYPGKIYEDGVGALIDIIKKSGEKITVIAIGPVPNLAEALRRDPSIAENANFVGMHGSVYLGYDGSEKISAEYNVRMDIKACQKVFTTQWDMVITPLDTCGLVHLRGDKYAKVRNSNDPVARALVENYRIWSAKRKNGPVRTDEKASSTLFDTVAIYLGFSDELCEMKTLPIVVDDKGYTRIKEGAKEMKVATKWKDMGKFEDLLVERIVAPGVYESKAAEKPRIIATTDGEIDDRCSMVRFLLYTNEWDIEGIIISSSEFHWKGHDWAGVKWINEDIDLYAKSYENLKKHDPDFPSPEELKKLVYVGNIDNVGEMKKDTPGSDRIVEVLLDDKGGPVYLQAWGGTNTIARALWKIQHKFPEQMKKVSEKAIIYIILDQDETFREYIQPNWPTLQVLGSFRQFATVAYDWEEIIPEVEQQYYDADWMKRNILNSHGPLCASYEAHGDGRFRSEGDTPAFWHQIDVGLRSLEHPTYGGWGGRFVKEKKAKNVWRGAKDDGNWSKPLWRWSEASQNDWAARADWCVKDYEHANHPPVVKLAHAPDLKAKPGQTVKLSAKGKDPDGDKLSYKWWQYREPSSCKGEVKIQAAKKPQASFELPEDAKPGRTVHIICEVTDDGDPPLTRYARVIVEFE